MLHRTSRIVLAVALAAAGRRDEARAALQDALAVRVACVGVRHPHTQRTQRALDAL